MARTFTKNPHPYPLVLNENNGDRWIRWFHDLWNHVKYLLVRTNSSTQTTTYTILVTDFLVLGDATSAAFTITLPTAAAATGQEFIIKKIDSSGNAVTVDGDGVETIDGATTKALAAQYDVVHVYSDGTEWHII